MKRPLTKIIIDELFSKPPNKKYETKKINCNHLDEIWTIDLIDVSDYKNSNNKGLRCSFAIIDDLYKHTWCIPLETKNAQTITDKISLFSTTSKIPPLKLESDRGANF